MGSPFVLLDVQTSATNSIPSKPCKFCRLNIARNQWIGATAAACFLRFDLFHLGIPRQSQNCCLPELSWKTGSPRRCLTSWWHKVPLHGWRMHKAGNSSQFFPLEPYFWALHNVCWNCQVEKPTTSEASSLLCSVNKQKKVILGDWRQEICVRLGQRYIK